MPNGTYGGVRGKETKAGQKAFVSRPTRLCALRLLFRLLLCPFGVPPLDSVGTGNRAFSAVMYIKAVFRCNKCMFIMSVRCEMKFKGYMYMIRTFTF